MTMPDLDLTDPTLLLRDDVLADPKPLYAKLRREAPVWHLPGQDTFLVSDPKLVREAVRRSVRAAIGQAWGKRPICKVMINVID